MNPPRGFRIGIKSLFPILTDRGASAGLTGDHYFLQDLWAAKKIFERNPREHLDVGSRIDGFVAHLLSFRSVTVVDLRPLDENIPGLRFCATTPQRWDWFKATVSNHCQACT